MPKEECNTDGISRQTAKDIYERLNDHGERLKGLEANVTNMTRSIDRFVEKMDKEMDEQQKERALIFRELGSLAGLKKLAWIIAGALIPLLLAGIFYAAFSPRHEPAAATKDK